MRKNKRNRRLISFFLVAILCINIAGPGIRVWAEETPKIIYINTAEDLIELAKKCALDTWSQGKTIILNKDIDLTNKNFTSIPTFGGTFDGQGYTISGLTLEDYGSPKGFFRYVQAGALVKKLTIKGTITPIGTKTIIGGIAGSNSGILQNCVFTGTIKGDKQVGGIAGINESSGFISNCVAQGVQYGEHQVGGIVGENFGRILLCTNEALVNTTVEENTFGLKDLEKINAGNLTSFSTENVVDITDVGGVAGLSSGIIQSSTNNGVVGYQHVGYNIGGIVGRQSGYVNDCVNTGEVYGRKDVGGIAGQIEPYGTWKLSGDSLDNLRKELNTLQGLINNMVNNSKYYSSEMSSELTRTQGYMDEAQTAGADLAEQTRTWVNGSLDSINDVSARITQTIVASGPILEEVASATETMSDAIGQYRSSMQNLDSAASSLETGMDMLYPALDKLDKALSSSKTAVNYIIAALTTLKSSLGDSVAVEAAVKEIQVGITKLTEATDKINVAANDLLKATDVLMNSEAWKNTAPIIQEGASELVTATNEMAAAMQIINDALTALQGDIDWEELGAVLTSLESAMTKLTSAAEKSASGFSKIATGMEKITNAYGDNDETQQAWKDIETGLDMIQTAIGDGSAIDYANVSKGLGIISDSLAILIKNTDIGVIQEGLKDINAGTQELAESMKDIQATTSDLQEMVKHLQAANPNPEKTKADVEVLMKGFEALTAQSKAAADSLAKINKAINQLLQSEEAKAYSASLKTNLKQISAGISDAMSALKTINTGAKKLSEQIDISKLSASISYLTGAAQNIGKAVAQMQSILSDLKNADPYFSSAAGLASQAFKKAAEATGTLKEASKSLTRAVEGLQDLIADLAKNPKITFEKFDNNYRETQVQLSDSLGNISKSLSKLNTSFSGASDTLLSDIQAISNQTFKVFNLLIGAVEDVSEMSTNIKDYTEDISVKDTEKDTGGKIDESFNHGPVNGDVNVGGISGAMAVEYNFDLEDDLNMTNKMSPGSKYLLRAVVSKSENDGVVIAKKHCVGGIVGLMDFGFVTKAVDSGLISSTSGDYVGGIAGKSNGTISKSYAKSGLAGAEYVGGIAGYGLDILNCYTLVRIERANEFIGTIAGDVAGKLEGNYFVSDAQAGVNGISQKGKAEPMVYQNFVKAPGLPEVFKKFRLSFVVDQKEIGRVLFDYGDSVNPKEIPKVPEKEGYFGEWSLKVFENLTFDEILQAVYKPYRTTLASQQSRDGGPSVILVDGLFTNDSKLTVMGDKPMGKMPMGTFVERWQVNVTDDGQAEHTVRYLAPKGKVQGLNIYGLEEGKWRKLDYKLEGSYMLFKMEGLERDFLVMQTANTRNLIALAGGGILLLLLYLGRRRKKLKAKPLKQKV